MTSEALLASKVPGPDQARYGRTTNSTDVNCELGHGVGAPPARR